MKTYGRGGTAPPFLNLALEGGDLSDSLPGETALVFSLYVTLDGPLSRFGRNVRRKFLSPDRENNSDFSVVQPVP
jgi:hypothetical protein